ncbi:MAG TPA: right-handed parallel beta-helix repeat-containing protein, partial [Anaerolineae bacterium]|nr:right-handed parallel beta-helix repeat-containing protein [Anaerolineae bacterium]
MNEHARKAGPLTAHRRWGSILLALSLIAAYLVHPPTLSAVGTYYVDAATGSDSNPGTPTAPWRTIQKAADTMSAGDTVRVHAGNYPERVRVTRSGADGAPITFEAEGTVTMGGFTVRAASIAIRGFEISGTPNAWDDGWGIFVEGSHAVIENNHVHDATRGGILLWAEPGDWGIRTNSIVRNNRLYRNAMVGIEFHGRNHLIEGNEVWRTIQYHPNWVPAPSYADADGMRFFGSGHIVKFNYIHDI